MLKREICRGVLGLVDSELLGKGTPNVERESAKGHILSFVSRLRCTFMAFDV
jgi:hypothetical protein